MKFIKTIFYTLWAIVPSVVISQNMNRISVQTGLMHCFFDDSPLMNTNYSNRARGVFGGLLYNSLGLQYSRRLNTNSSISFEYLYFYEGYWNVHPNLLKNVVTERGYNTFNFTYERNLFFNQYFSFTYGSGINYRNGYEAIVVNYGYFAALGTYESLVETRSMNDIGINIRTGIEYSPLKWLTLFTKFDLIGFIYLNDQKAIERLKKSDSYNYGKYPHRFDLSWRFGMGFNFGK